jgi:hypothetical protein
MKLQELLQIAESNQGVLFFGPDGDPMENLEAELKKLTPPVFTLN